MATLIWLELLDRKVGVGPNDEGLSGPSEGYRFYHGDKEEPLQGSDIRYALWKDKCELITEEIGNQEILLRLLPGPCIGGRWRGSGLRQ